MSGKLLLQDVEAWKHLAENRQRCEQISKLDQGKDRQAWTLTHAFADLEQSFRRVLDDQLPSFMSPGKTSEQIYDLLLDIGEEFRHILYHIHGPRFYAYLETPEGQNRTPGVQSEN